MYPQVIDRLQTNNAVKPHDLKILRDDRIRLESHHNKGRVCLNPETFPTSIMYNFNGTHFIRDLCIEG